MKSEALILLLLIWSSAESSAPAEGASKSEFSLGNNVIKKQEECEAIISETINKILDDEDSDPHGDIVTADDNYQDCKEELDELKREYMAAYNIDRSTNTEFFRVRVNEGSSELVSVPPEEGAEIDFLQFDVNEELCITYKICDHIMGQLEKENETDKKQHYKERFAHCHILLDTIKYEYIKEKELDEKKLKEEGGMSVTCAGKPILMSLPHFMNNLDYHTSQHGLFSDVFPADLPHLTPEESSPTVETLAGDHQAPYNLTPEEDKQIKHTEPNKETSENVKGTRSKAAIDKSNLICCILFIFVLVSII